MLKLSNFDKRFVILLLSITALRFVFVLTTPLDLNPDEAHYWEWTRRIDWAYYSKGPVVALLIKLGTLLFGDTELGVRFGAILCSTVFLLLLYALLRELYSDRLAFSFSLLITFTLIFFSFGLIMTTDPPFLMFLMGALFACYLALEKNTSYWLVFGICLGLATLSKYTALIFYPSILCFLLYVKEYRKHLLSSYFIIGTFLFFLCLSPVLIWNWSNGWVNFFHNAKHITPKNGPAFELENFFGLLGGQLGLFGPLLCIGLVYATYQAILNFREGRKIIGLFLFPAVFLGGFCLVLSLIKRVYPNWPIPAGLCALFLLADLVHRGKFKTWVWPTFYLNLSITLFASMVFYGFSFGLPTKILPTKKLVGWRQLGAVSENALKEIEAVSNARPFVIAENYRLASQLAFYTPSHPEVYCDNDGTRRMNQYDVWGGWEKLKGENALVIIKNSKLNPSLAERFERFEKLDGFPKLEIEYAGEKLKYFEFYLGTNYSGRAPVSSTTF